MSNNKVDVSVGSGFKFGLGFTLGSFVASMIILPALACLGFLVTSVIGGGLAAMMQNMGR